MRLGLKVIFGKFEEDLTKIGGGVAFQRFLIKPEINVIECVELVLIQGIQWYLILENQSMVQKLRMETKVQL